MPTCAPPWKQDHPSDGLTLIGDRYGRPIQRSALTELVKRAAKAARLPSHCLPHGLRKAILRRLAESGGTAKEIAGVSGHKTLEEIELYTSAADQQKLAAAAMNKLEK
jgi:integrase